MNNKKTNPETAAEALTDRLATATSHISEHPKVSYAALCGRAARAGIPKETVVGVLEQGIEASLANARNLIDAAYEAAKEGGHSGPRTKFDAPALAAIEL